MKSHASARRVLALVGHRPGVQTLWLVSKLHSHRGVDLLGVAPQREDEVPVRGWTKLTRRLLTDRLRNAQEHLLDELFDGQSLRRWWSEEASVMTGFPSLDHPHAAPGIAALAPDVIVFFRRTGPATSLAALPGRRVLVARIGNRSVEDAMDAVVQSIAQERAERLTLTIHEVNPGGDSERCLWSASPQIAPGDTGESILLKAAAELSVALARGVDAALASAGRLDEATYDTTPVHAERAESEATAFRTWLTYLRSARGRHSRYVYERAVRC
jgi:hypothetical protein